jgi:hypothetical protein
VWSSYLAAWLGPCDSLRHLRALRIRESRSVEQAAMGETLIGAAP